MKAFTIILTLLLSSYCLAQDKIAKERLAVDDSLGIAVFQVKNSSLDNGVEFLWKGKNIQVISRDSAHFVMINQKNIRHIIPHYRYFK